MEFATFILATQRGYHQTSDSVIHDAIEQTVLSEQAGFNTAWFAEHHFNNYSLVPSPLMMVAHCAGVTKEFVLEPLSASYRFISRSACSPKSVLPM